LYLLALWSSQSVAGQERWFHPTCVKIDGLKRRPVGHDTVHIIPFNAAPNQHSTIISGQCLTVKGVPMYFLWPKTSFGYEEKVGVHGFPLCLFNFVQHVFLECPV